MPKEVTIKLKIPTGDELAEAIKKTLEQFGGLVKIEAVVEEEKPKE